MATSKGKGKPKLPPFKNAEGLGWTILDVVAFILQRHTKLTGVQQMTAMKLHRLLFYSQAGSLVWDERPLFDEPIQAWASGPVVPEIYRLHNGSFKLTDPWPEGADPTKLDDDAVATIDGILKWYGIENTHWLNNLVQSEDPWRDARKNCQSTRCEEVIARGAMAEFYAGKMS